MVVSLTGFNFFMQIFSFLFVFILVYAILSKTKILGDNNFIHLFISFLLAIFFIVNVSLTNFVTFNAAWFAVFIVCLFFIMVLIGFTHGKVDVIMNKYVAWVLVAGLILFFIISSSYIFTWTLNWSKVWGWFSTDWFGFVILLILAGIVSWIISSK
jgi:hypothetical protein